MKTLTICLILTFIFTGLAAQAARNLPQGAETETICLSLRELSKQAKNSLKDDTIKYFAFISYPEGYIIDAANQDIIILGKHDKDRPNLTLDDFVVNLRNIWNNLEEPFCSLDPYPANIVKLQSVLNEQNDDITKAALDRYLRKAKAALGNQKTVIGGVPRNSRHAHTMINADYIMKQYSQGLIEDDTAKSCLGIMEDRSEADPEARTDPNGSMSRFWFHIAEDNPKYEVNGNTVLLDACEVVILTEQQAQSSDGDLYDVTEKEPIAQAFAKNHSELFPQLASYVNDYANLENLYRLHALLKAIKYRDDADEAQVSFNYLLNSYRYSLETPMPESLPCLANYTIIDKSYTVEQPNYKEEHTILYSPIVLGGVSMKIPVNKKSFKQTYYKTKLEKDALSARPSQNSLTWKF